MKGFEEDLIKLISDVSFRNVNDPFLKQVNEDIKNVNSSKNVFVFADKTTNVYETDPESYRKLLTENITKTYKIGNSNITDDINEELRDITNNLSIGNRVDVMAKRDAFITIKDHKENFPSNVKCRLINPSKGELGKVSKVILDNINNNIRSAINVNQWKNSNLLLTGSRTSKENPTIHFYLLT
jgi:hypothetical protein